MSTTLELINNYLKSDAPTTGAPALMCAPSVSAFNADVSICAANQNEKVGARTFRLAQYISFAF
jgi:hypothetical protein